MGKQEKPRIVALVPMRHNSERVPGKNYRKNAGKPLYHYIIQTLSDCKEISDIVVNTDSPEILEGLASNFPKVIRIKRPKELIDGKISMNKVLEYDLDKIEADYYLQSHSTNPLLKSSTVSKAIETFLQNKGRYDSLFSVTRLQTRLYGADSKAINHDPNILIRTQDLPPIYEENSCIYIFTKENFLQKNNRIGDRPLLYEIDASEAFDIDNELDFQMTEFLLKHKQ